MNKDQYLQNLKNYNEWFKQAASQKNIADKILHNCILDKAFLIDLKQKGNYEEYVSLWANAHYHYGIGIENGLKGLIIKHQPDKIQHEVTNQDIILKNIGGKAGKSHNLYELAKTARVFKNEKLYTHSWTFEALERVLLHFSDMIKWGSRYPIPNKLSNINKFDGAIPSTLVYGFHILDIINPLYELFKSEEDQ